MFFAASIENPPVTESDRRRRRHAKWIVTVFARVTVGNINHELIENQKIYEHQRNHFQIRCS